MSDCSPHPDFTTSDVYLLDSTTQRETIDRIMLHIRLDHGLGRKGIREGIQKKRALRRLMSNGCLGKAVYRNLLAKTTDVQVVSRIVPTYYLT